MTATESYREGESMNTELKRQLAVFAAVVALFFAGGVVLVVLGIRSYGESRAFADRAESASGTVIGFETSESSTDGLREDLHFAIVRYTTADGNEIRFQGPSVDGLAKLDRGETVRVLYDPRDPQAARVDSFMGLWFGATMFGVVGVGAALVPLLTLWRAYRWAQRQA